MKKLKKAMAVGLTALSMASGVKMGAMQQTSVPSQEVSERTRIGTTLFNTLTLGIGTLATKDTPNTKELIYLTAGAAAVVFGIYNSANYFEKNNINPEIPNNWANPTPIVNAGLAAIGAVSLAHWAVGTVADAANTLMGKSRDENNKPIKKWI